MRTIKELLILLREQCIINVPELGYGICGTMSWLVMHDIISRTEYSELIMCVELNEPKHPREYGSYWWKPGELAPRLEFLDKLIAEL